MILSKFRYQQAAKLLSKSSIRQAVGRSCYDKSRENVIRLPKVSPTLRFISGVALTATLSYKLSISVKVADCKRKTWAVREDDHNREFNWTLFLRFLAPESCMMVIAIVSSLAVAVINIMIATYLGDIISVVAEYTREGLQVTRGSFFEAVRGPAARLVAIYTAQGIFTWIYLWSLSDVGEGLSSRLRAALFKSILQQDIAYFDATKTGEIMNILSGDVQEFKSCFKLLVSQGLRNIVQTIGCAIKLYAVSPKMTGFMLIIVTSIVTFGTILGSELRRLSTLAQAQMAHAIGVADEAVANIRTVRAFAMEDIEQSHFSNELMRAEYLNVRTGFWIGGFQALSNIAMNGITLGIIFMGGKLMGDGEITPGNFMSFMVAAQMIQRSLGQVFVLFSQYVKAKACGARVLDMIAMKSIIPLRGGAVIPEDYFSGEIRLRNVTFAYPTRPDQNVVDHLSLNIPPGKVVALCGSSGSGKSTVAALIERFYDVNSGEVLIDGVNIKHLDGHWLRGSAIGSISQEPVLFASSILENIRYSRPSATDEEVMEAAKLANAHDFIMSFEKGYNTQVGERGVTISGGQRQRIAIARALLKNPQILILDEATSALDTQSEKMVQETLDRIVKGKTVLVIAHRLSTIRNADIIYVLRNGKVVESGDHATLTSLKGVYWRLVQEQVQDNPMESESKSFFGRSSG
ncbi:ATP-binding cassette sub-family B member 8, mitochondrial-like isoform X1 [Varroa jacobsoni]|uniref:ATP-binding cassette sub-family B member 8, mitochondrial-like n=1 Tax=Varroa jacobsoni TaxID=62625 RepID=UPI000BF8013D|nr:ATP-binding cassette sub-family B member 8, mitochondrial-like [Varroa jacobsoni]XP_022687540.1 ATP-binding cassette sub-family B member 8, mitochondrial-like isoform X1 [Varroa jacobsoni]XP_022687541.1 ATP-binding cassette sub-family B member 8, mitochondrial-like isoform X1 [Varroa jacobsoni]XP_022687542.1 ATP-binding cassette sub-family B member 8, mitochondrial-like isoform X1 [Varroa jacobsoni]